MNNWEETRAVVVYNIIIDDLREVVKGVVKRARLKQLVKKLNREQQWRVLEELPKLKKHNYEQIKTFIEGLK